MASAQGERVEVAVASGRVVVRQEGWRLMRGLEPLDPAAFDAWNALWQGAVSVHDRRLTLEVTRRADQGDRCFEWQIKGG
jgi:hypothetical protein